MVFSLWGKAEEPLPRLDGRVIIVTGATAGIGLKTAQRLAELGATVIIACRNVKKGDDVCQQLRTKATTTLDLRVMELDLSSLQSVQKFANDFLALDLPLHVLLNNAGLLHTTYVESQDGLEDMFAVNHLGHFFLTFLRCLRCARDVAQVGGVVQGMRVYGRSKLCNILFSNYLATKLEGTGVTSVSLHPGMVNTDIGKSEGSWWMHVLFAPVRLFIRDVEQGAKTSVWCAASKEAEGVSGKYFDNPGAERTPEPQALDPVAAQQLWDLSCRLVEEKTGTKLVWPLPPPKH